MKIDHSVMKLYLQRQDKYLANKFTDIMLGLFSPKILIVSFVVIVMGSMWLITKPATLGETEQAAYHWLAISIGGIFGVYGFGALFFLCKLPKLKPLLSATCIQEICNESMKAYDEMALPVDVSRSGINYLHELISNGIPMNFLHEKAVKKMIENDKFDKEIEELSKKMTMQSSF
ncbi:hypothetical protein EGJ31_22970 [Serratia marcescens]|uniref:hypothetical protein n=1 Tax=Serratia marcescens TaxID=615 RepID=UPI000F73E9EF|nr:hypothetical protein [Serratia marcescens]RRU14423.1 hypothetical protein EGJ16_21110 [Serratia marcescens]RRU16472.1 hypothetical protein EGJ10_23030 [Serratia marcescens]RRU26376.1 hypothetical protein EGJ02_22990 [Serratia marcescens]RRU27869.1 hypothetical protein EGJ31_22970 [Serratia marcescens]RRU39761.1 hypothetical protein EGJ04_23385 [Serratia marcescens]